MNQNIKLSITRNSGDMISVRVRDAISRVEVVRAEFTPADFAMLITGLSEVESVTNVYGDLKNVGKCKVSEKRQATHPTPCYRKEELTQWLLETQQEEGWTIDPYLGRQGSVVWFAGLPVLNYSVFKYVDPT